MLPEIKAEICITGVKISPEEITNLIGITPTKTWKVGEIIQKTSLKRKRNGWVFSTGTVVGLDLTELVKELLETLLPKADVINQISSVYDLHCEFSFIAYVSNEMPVINFDKDIVHGLAKLNASIDIDVILTE